MVAESDILLMWLPLIDNDGALTQFPIKVKTQFSIKVKTPHVMERFSMRVKAPHVSCQYELSDF